MRSAAFVGKLANGHVRGSPHPRPFDGAGLSTAAGFTYDGERFERYLGDFGEKYHFADM